MTEKTMTNRDFYTKVIASVEDEEIKAFAAAALAKMDETNSKRSAKNAEKREANLAFAKEVLGALTEKPQTASEIAAQFGVSPQKISHALSLVAGEFDKTTVKIDSKKRVAYTVKA